MLCSKFSLTGKVRSSLTAHSLSSQLLLCTEKKKNYLPTFVKPGPTADTYSLESFSCDELTSDEPKLAEGELEYHPYPSSVGITICFPTTLPGQKQRINTSENTESKILSACKNTAKNPKNSTGRLCSFLRNS